MAVAATASDSVRNMVFSFVLNCRIQGRGENACKQVRKGYDPETPVADTGIHSLLCRITRMPGRGGDRQQKKNQLQRAVTAMRPNHERPREHDEPHSDSTSIRVQRWLDRLHAGDLIARDELIRSACRRLEWMSRKALKNFPGVHRWEDTSDVRQNAMVRLAHALNKHVPSSARDFFALAGALIRRELIDLLRHYYGPLGHGAHHDSDLRGNTAPSGPPVVASEDVPRLATWTAFHECIERLEPIQREVFSLKWYHGLEMKEAAHVLGLSERTVKLHWREARLKLRAEFTGELLE
jgi:RNA polymerase sigma factor (sigma-70 family)